MCKFIQGHVEFSSRDNLAECSFFFFQAEDGIRDLTVTGVQTCALPIYDHLFCMITMNHHPLHTNEWFAENETVHKQNVVVGNLVYSLVLGMSVPDVSGSCIANLEVESLTHQRPTFHGDTIYAETRVLDKRESSSRPDRGVVTVETKGFNQRGEEVCFFRRKVMVPKRAAAAPRERPYESPTGD